MKALTVISDPTTGLLFESPHVYRDGATAYRLRPEDFRPLQDATRLIPTPDGCTVGENAVWLQAGEYVEWNGVVAQCG
jgi:hypothetical protein